MLNPKLPKIVFVLAQLLILIFVSFPSIAAEKYKINTKNFGKHQYQILSSQKFKSTGIKLLGKGAPIKSINKSLKNDFENQLIEEAGCVEAGGFSTYITTIIDWNKKFVVTHTEGGQGCGGAHDIYGSHAQVYNLKTGKLEVTSLWLNDYKKEYEALDYSEIERNSELDQKLRELYLKQNSLNEELKIQAEDCVEGISFYTPIWATSKGLIFKPSGPYAGMPCYSEVVMPFDEAIPFLTKEGKQAIQAFRE